MAEMVGQARMTVEDKPLKIADREFRSRLILGTGKWRSNEEMLAALEASGCEMVTVALRRIDFDDPKSRSILEVIDWTKYQILPNTAGCRTAEEAIRVARLARAMGLSNWVKLEVIPDPKYLLPDPIGTLEAAKVLVKEGFVVLPYINQDPVLAKQLEEIGCATVMPLASPIGSGQGLPDFRWLQIIVEQANVPVIVDAGIGAPSDAALAMELGADACLINTAIAQAGDPVKMARAMRLAIEAGRLCYLAGRIPKKPYASASSPLEGVVR
ncbi:Thiazole synthase [bacterium HR28]|uniref:Thiazole synthase n=1 Tax=Thermomicrobium roseum TaxID=500 RepID=A0A7C1JUL3_THERO|nr:Thiazole synthase [bacterium HR28]